MSAKESVRSHAGSVEGGQRWLDDVLELVRRQDELLVCYRTGRQPSGRLLDRLRSLRGRV